MRLVLKINEIDLREPIAIIGMGCQFPGAGNYEEYWSNIFSNKCFIEELTADSDVVANYDENYKTWNKSSTKLCARVKPFEFPYRRFKGVTPHSINHGDFYIKYSLLAAQDAIDDAGAKAFDSHRDDVFVAVGHYNYETKAIRFHAESALRVFIDDLKKTPTFKSLTIEMQEVVIKNLEKNFFHVNENIPHETIIASMGPAVASRITKLNKFNGGFTSVDSACASSVAALDIAIRRLRDGSSKVAVVGGIGVLSPYFFVHCSKAHTMSTKGSFPFDKRASGFVVGEGSGFVVLKPLSEALKNKDRIHAVIRGVAGASDGSQRGPWAPNKEGQKLAYHRALNQAGYSFDEIQYIECHGTGTQVGDKEELKGLCDLIELCKLSELNESKYQKEKIIIGSAKGSVGHLLPGAGMAGLIRTVMALKNGHFPPTAGAETPIDELMDPHFPFEIITKSKIWKRRQPNIPRRAMLNSFGYGGTDYNIQLEEFDENFHANYFKSDINLNSQHKVKIDNYLESIAIVGIGIKLPGAESLTQFHENNLSAKSFFSSTPQGRYSKKITDKLEELVGEKLSELQGGYTNLPTEQSKLKWRIPPSEIKDIDPNQFRLLEVVKNSLEDANLIDKKMILEKTAMICGVMMDSDFFAFEHTSIRFNALLDQIKSLPGIPSTTSAQLAQDLFETVKNDLYELSKDSAVSGIDSMLGSRVAKFFDLKGGSLSLDAVCATGMVALDHGTRLLRSRELDAVVVCSSTMGMSAQLKECYNQMTGGWLNEASKPFDQKRKGFLIGEGAVSFVLKRLDDAVKSGDKIYSVIRSIGISSDGSSSQMLQPSYLTAKKAFERAINGMNTTSVKVEAVECHGIGTITSDQVEMQIIKEIYADPQQEEVTLGALKGSIGHLKVTSAFATVARAALSLYYNKKYPVAGFQNPDPFLLENPFLKILTKPEDYKQKERFCGVTSFGLGGVNGHLIMSNFDPETSQLYGNKIENKLIIEKAKPIIISGEALQRGKQMGQLWKKTFASNYDHIWGRLPANLFTQKQELTEIFLKWLPEEYKVEIDGIAQGADLPTEVVLWANCLTMAVTTQYGLCSGFAKNGIHGSNYDFPFATKNDNALLPREVLEVHRLGRLPFIGVFLLGSPFPYTGINSAGISISTSSGTALGKVSDGLFIYALIREILENCTSLSEVKIKMDQKTVSGSWILLVSKDSSALHIEICESECIIREEKVVFATNHFQYLKESLPQRLDSLFRLDRLNSLIQNFNGSSDDGLNILSDKYDLSRKKFTKFSTSNTLNRYNSAVSALISQKDKKMFVSCQNIPSGEGPYRVYDLNFKKPEMSLSVKTLLNKTHWSLNENNNVNRHNIFLLYDQNTETYHSYLNQNKNTSFILRINRPDFDSLVKWVDNNEFDLIDINEINDSTEMEQIIELFQQKVSVIRQLIKLNLKPKRIFSFGWDKSYIISNPLIETVSTLSNLSKPFFKSLVKEGFGEYYFSIDVFRNFDIHYCLEQLNKNKIPSANEIFCFNEELFEVGFTPHDLGNETIAIDKNELVLFTGGLSGIGFECLKALIQKNPNSTYVILGKTNLNTIDFNITNKEEFLIKQAQLNPGLKPKDYLQIWNQNQKQISLLKNWKVLKAQSPHVHYYTVDLRNKMSLETTVNEIQTLFGNVHHLVHSAGTEISKHFNKKTENEFNSIFYLKTKDTLNFMRFLNTKNLKNIILFSSIAGEFGNEGQSDYSASNGFYKSLSLELMARLPKVSVKNILWSGWDEVGMAAKESVKPLLLTKGYTLMSVNEGIKNFLRLFHSKRNLSQVIVHSTLDKSISIQGSEWVYSNSDFKRIPTSLVDKLVLINDSTYLFEKEFSGEEIFLKDHIIKGKRTVPGVFWIDMLIQCLNFLDANNSKEIFIDELNFIELCAVNPEFGKKIRLKLQKKSGLQWEFSFSSTRESTKRDLLKMETIHSSGTLSWFLATNHSNLEINPRLITELGTFQPGSYIYNALASSFSGYIGKSYRCIEAYQLTSNKINLLIDCPRPFHWGYIFDTINQAAVLWSPQVEKFNFLPHSMLGVQITPKLLKQSKMFISLELINTEAASLKFKASIYDTETGKEIISIKTVKHKIFGNNDIIREINL